MAVQGEAVSRRLVAVDEGEPLLCARTTRSGSPTSTCSAGRCLERVTAARRRAGLAGQARTAQSACSCRLRPFACPSPLVSTRYALPLLATTFTRDTVVDRSSLDVARGGDSHGRSPFVSFPLSSPSPRSLPLHRSFALLRLFYSLTSQTCYASTLTQYDALKPGEAGSLGAWCDDAGFTSAMKRCWDQNCGQQQWDAACSYAASTSSMWDKAHSSVAAKVATKPRNTVLPLVTSTVTPSTSATAIAIAQSDTVRLASSASTSGALKLLCTSLFALIGAVILAVVVFLEAGPSL
uniref:BY PROTMAP: gi/342319137/gb/EGU11088.1/ integral membrane protein [Rhodotorula glutinis ATCC 204091] n=1 Tax=Rhodotorula toruloides TaxID=5286 RepID=A0A0K3CAY8_RHOTO